MKINNLMLDIEFKTMLFYNELKKDIPKLSALTFEITELSKGARLHGFCHIGNNCASYDSIDELKSLLLKEMRAVESYDEKEDGLL